MKTKVYIAVALMAFIAITAVFWIQSCRKPVGTIEDNQSKNTSIIQGYIKDAGTGIGIENVIISFNNQKVLTDLNGKYTLFYNLTNIDKIPVKAIKEGYSDGFFTINITPKNISVVDIFLRKLNNSVIIGLDGGEIIEFNSEGIDSTLSIKVNFQQNAFEHSQPVSLTPLYGNEVPNPLVQTNSDTILLNAITLNLYPNNIILGNEAIISVPLPFKLNNIISFPIYRFNSDNNTWVKQLQMATYSDESGLAQFSIKQLGIYTIALPVKMEIKKNPIVYHDTIKLDEGETEMKIDYKIQPEFPEGLSTNINAYWLSNIYSQIQRVPFGKNFQISYAYNETGIKSIQEPVTCVILIIGGVSVIVIIWACWGKQMSDPFKIEECEIVGQYEVPEVISYTIPCHDQGGGK